MIKPSCLLATSPLNTGWCFGTWMDYFSIILGMSESQLTRIFQRGRAQPPTSNSCLCCHGEIGPAAKNWICWVRFTDSPWCRWYGSYVFICPNQQGISGVRLAMKTKNLSWISPPRCTPGGEPTKRMISCGYEHSDASKSRFTDWKLEAEHRKRSESRNPAKILLIHIKWLPIDIQLQNI